MARQHAGTSFNLAPPVIYATLKMSWAARADSIIKARTVGYLVGIGVRIVEAKDLGERLKALESILKARNEP